MSALSRSVRCVVLALGGLTVTAGLSAQVPVQTPTVQAETDPELARYIASVQAIDNHAHTVLPPPNDKTDHEFDALPVDSMEPQTDPVAMRDSNPQLAAAWQALWGFTSPLPLSADAAKALDAKRDAVKAREGANYDNWVLDRAGIGTQVANRVSMGQGLAKPRFQWVPYGDTLLFPLNNSAMTAATPDKAQFFPLEAKVMQRYLKEAGIEAVPASLDNYITKLVEPILRAQRQGGAIAIKFEIAYLRGFDFGNPSREQAARVYEQALRKKSAPSESDYKLLQDYLFRRVCLLAGQMGMAVHLHTGEGAGSYYSLAGANPMLLEPVFNDPNLRKTTNFVMLHGGWPFVQQTGSLLQKPNVYVDLSQQGVLFPPRTLSTWLREWLELYPDKVFYGTDGYPYSAAMGWEESSWIANRTVREALGLALTGMLRDGEIDLPRAKVIAEMVLHGNAAKLYKIQ